MTDGTDEALPAFQVPRPPRRRWPWIALALVVVAGAVFGGVKLFGADDPCGSGRHRAGALDECIGVSDGSYVFEPSLATVMGKIHAENQAVEKSGKKWVDVAYVEPITTDLTQEAVKYGVREELEGAYLAQLQLNDAQLGGHGDTPQIRLLVANIGLRSEQWKPLTDRLIAMTKGEHPLVAVAGFGQSRGGTLDAVNALRAAKVPMMGATVTADNLASAAQVGFFRVSAPNSDQASAAVRYLRQQQTAHPGYQVLVVRDRAEDDIYNTSLYKDFERSAAAQHLTVIRGDREYVSGADGVSNAFSAVADQVYDIKPDAVFFAGRGIDLRNFITAMAVPERRSETTVVTGDDGMGVYSAGDEDKAARERFVTNWKNSGVNALYTGLGHPELPGKVYPDGHDPYPGFRDLYQQHFGGGEDAGDAEFQDGQGILGHDAVWTLGVAIRNAAGDGSAVVNTGSTLNALVSGTTVAGVTGPIELGSDGNPQDKPMALVHLEPDGTFAFQAVIHP